MREEWKDEYDFVLVNSPPGSDDLAAICTVQLADALIAVMPPDSHDFERAAGLVDAILKARQKLPFERGAMVVVPVVSSVLHATGVQRVEAERKLLALTTSWRHRSVGAREFLDQLTIPASSERDGTPLAEWVEVLASIIARSFSDTDELFKERAAYVAGARRPAGAKATSVSGREEQRWVLLKPSLPPLDWRVRPGTRAEGAYKYYIDAGGRVLPAYLTYSLFPSESERRSVLLTLGSEDLLSDEERAEFRQLTERIKESAGGRMRAVKSVVNRIVEGQAAVPNVRVVAHKFGPVPVYVPRRMLVVDSLGGPLPVMVGLYPQDVPLTASPFGGSKSEFVQSLTVGLGLMFRRYLEDVGEAMSDIENHLNHAEVFGRAKEIEVTFGESVVTKLQALIPSPESLHRPASKHERLVGEIFSEERYAILNAEYARLFALFFLNELYGHLGLGSRSEKYLAKLMNVAHRFDRLLGQGFASDAREFVPELRTLSGVLRDYRVGRYEEVAGEVRGPGEAATWVSRFVRFAGFISRLNLTKVSPVAGRIFISQAHSSESETLDVLIASHIKARFGGRAEVLGVNRGSLDAGLAALLRSRIWLSDSVFALLTDDSRGIDRGCEWVAAEARYGLLLGKRVVALVGEDVSAEALEAWRAKLANGYDPEYLGIGGTRHTLPRADDLPAIELRRTEPMSMDRATLISLEEEVWVAAQRRHDALLSGWLALFTRETRRTVGYINLLAKHPTTKRRLARQLLKHYPDVYRNEAAAGKAIGRAWAVASRRVLLLDGEPQTLIHLSGGSRKKPPMEYSGNLINVLRKLRPDLGPGALSYWTREVLRGEVAPLGEPGATRQARMVHDQYLEFSSTRSPEREAYGYGDAFDDYETDAMMAAWVS